MNQVYPFPLQTPRLEAHLYWHESVENDPANRWLREEIEKVLAPEFRPTQLRRKSGNKPRRVDSQQYVTLLCIITYSLILVYALPTSPRRDRLPPIDTWRSFIISNSAD